MLDPRSAVVKIIVLLFLPAMLELVDSMCIAYVMKRQAYCALGNGFIGIIS